MFLELKEVRKLSIKVYIFWIFCRILIVINYRSFLFLDSQNPMMKAIKLFETSVTLH